MKDIFTLRTKYKIGLNGRFPWRLDVLNPMIKPFKIVTPAFKNNNAVITMKSSRV